MEAKPEYSVKPQEIKIPPCGNKSIKIIDALPDILVLHEKYIEIKYKSKIEDAKDGIPTTTQFRGNICYMKDKITAVRCFYVESDESYELNININEDKLAYCILFPSFAEALEVKNKIMEWLIK